MTNLRRRRPSLAADELWWPETISDQCDQDGRDMEWAPPNIGSSELLIRVLSSGLGLVTRLLSLIKLGLETVLRL